VAHLSAFATGQNRGFYLVRRKPHRAVEHRLQLRL